MTLPPPELADPRGHAFFLDFDGTLVDFADRPEDVALSRGMRVVLGRLDAAAGGAVAIVTGREISAIDRFIAPLRVPVAGVHGLERRTFAGDLHETPERLDVLDPLAEALTGFAAQRPGVLVERKAHAVALHFRQAPQYAAACRAFMTDNLPPADGFVILEGKCVLEFRNDAFDKGSAIGAFMEEAPFAGRVPVFAGDDVTDEDGFRVVNALGGATIKIGPGGTAARYRLDTISALEAWLDRVSSL